MSGAKFLLPSRKRCLELGAAFIEHDLHRMRQRSQEMYEQRRTRDGDDFDGSVRAQTSSHEGDLMQAVEWATAAATLRALAEREETTS